MSKPLIIENVWCLECNNQFFADRNEDHEYKCPKCNNVINFRKENMRYIGDK